MWGGGKGVVIAIACVVFMIGLAAIAYFQVNAEQRLLDRAYWWGLVPFFGMGIGLAFAERRALVHYRDLGNIGWVRWTVLTFFLVFALQLAFHAARIPDERTVLIVVSAYLLPYSYPAYFLGIAAVQAFLLRKYMDNSLRYMIPALICAPISVLVPFPAVCLYLLAGAYNLKNNLADYEPIFTVEHTSP